jgi:hypothetical protein
MKQHKKKDRFVTEETTRYTMNTGPEYEPKQAVGKKRRKSAIRTSEHSKSSSSIIKKHPIQVGEQSEGNGYFENAFTYVPGYSGRSSSK